MKIMREIILNPQITTREIAKNTGIYHKYLSASLKFYYGKGWVRRKKVLKFYPHLNRSYPQIQWTINPLDKEWLTGIISKQNLEDQNES